MVDTNAVKLSTYARKSSIAGVLLLALMAVTAFAPARASAQEDPVPNAELLIYDGVTGPYRVKIIQVPARVIIGTLRVIVEPTDAETGLPVENALVRIFGTPSGDGERQFSPGLNSPIDRTRYFGQLELEEAGVWTLDVEIDGDLGRAIAIAQATIYERVRNGDNTTIGTIIFAMITSAFVGVGIWLWYSSKRAQRRREAIRQGGGIPRRSSG